MLFIPQKLKRQAKAYIIKMGSIYMLGKLKKLYYNSSIKNKLALTYIIVIIIPFTILATASILVIEKSNIDKASFNSIQNLKQSVTNTESLLNNAVNILNIVVSNAWI